MLIYILSPTGKTLHFDFEPYQPFIKLKQKIYEQEGIPINQIRFFYKDILIDDYENCAKFNITSQSSFFFFKFRLILPKKIIILIKTIKNKSFEISILENATIEELKNEFYNQIGIRIEQHILYFKNEELKKDDHLNLKNIIDGSEISLI